MNSLRNNVVNSYSYAFISIRIIYLFSLAIIYFFIERFKGYLEVVIMLFMSLIVISHLLISFTGSQTVVLVLTGVIQYAYPVLHSILGGLLIMLGYLFYDTYHNMFILTMTAFVSMVTGILLPTFLVGRALMNIFCTLIFSVMAMVLIMFIQRHVFKEFDRAAQFIRNERRKMDQLKKIGNYDELTPREKEVLEYLASDYKNKEISSKLAISENTLKKHSKSIYLKLDIGTKKELKELVNKDTAMPVGANPTK